MPYQSVNPATGELLQTFEEHSNQQMFEALAAADNVYRNFWSTATYKERAKCIGRAAALMLQQKDALSRLSTIEMGKRIAESRSEVELSAAILKYYADNGEKFLAPRDLNSVMGDVLANQQKNAEIDRLFHELLAAAVPNGIQAASLWQNRVEYLARASRWNDATEAAIQVLSLRPSDPESYHTLAPLFAITGNASAYEELCEKLAARFPSTNDPVVAAKLAEDCLLLPRPGVDLKVAGGLADSAVTVRHNTTSNAVFECCNALTEYRLGHWNEATHWARRAPTNAPPFARAKAFAVLSLAQFEMGQVEAARTNLSACEQLVKAQLLAPDAHDLGREWRDWVIVHSLLNEAQDLIRSPTAITETPQPTNK